jgi:cysteinyl-tRNA synthetase
VSDLVLHDTLTGRKRPFEPADPSRVTVYVCGPTVYNYVHIGNGRPAVVFDVLVRLLRRRYGSVVYARNVTDIDDKINAAALEAGEPISAVADRFTQAYHEDVAALGVLEPDVEPRATEHVADIVRLIERLIERGHAYAAEGHVLFDVTSDPRYGALSHRSLDDLLAGARVEVAPYKRHPGDFVLWKPSTPELPGWDSPWGRGRPGWHIECTAMIHRHLGETIDIHGGGTDLVFPHHENEAAQGTCACGTGEYARYWLHNGMLTLGDQKMSKSVGNFVTIRDLLAQHPGEVLRYALLRGHYRSALAWGDALLDEARSALDRLYRALRSVEEASGPLEPVDPDAPLPDGVEAALCDDLNTPEALAALHELAGAINRGTDADEQRRLAQALRTGGAVLGLLGTAPAEWFAAGADAGSLDRERIEALVAERSEAKRNRDFARADAIRDELAAQNVQLEDTPDGTRWRLGSA